MIRSIYNWFVCPHRMVVLMRHIRKQGLLLLDVGCGNHSPAITKRYLPNVVYHGLANGRWNMDELDDDLMDRFICVDLNKPDQMKSLSEHEYDAIICSHILEHLDDPSGIAEYLVSNVRDGGLIYIEVPSKRSLSLPKTGDGKLVRGCLNFYDDETHTEPVDIKLIEKVLIEKGCKVIEKGTARLWRKILLKPLYIAACLVSKRFIPASVFWDITGFADYILLEKER